MSTILSEEKLRAIRAKHQATEDTPPSVSDFDVMTDFLESVHFVGPVRNWREMPELGDGHDDEDEPDGDDLRPADSK